jgi:hypothetical protein
MKSVKISPVVIEGQVDGKLTLHAGKLPVRSTNRTSLEFEILSFSRHPKTQTESAVQAPVTACVEVNALEGDQLAAPSLLVQIRWSLSF